MESSTQKQTPNQVATTKTDKETREQDTAELQKAQRQVLTNGA